MLIPPAAQGPGGRQVVGNVGTRGVQGSVPAATLWPHTSTQGNLLGCHHQSQVTSPLAEGPGPVHSQGLDRFELYSLFPGGGAGSYVAASPGPPATTQAPARTFHATTHKVSESMFSAAVGVGVGGYTWGAPTPPPGSPYSPVPVTQLELLAKNLANLAPHHAQQPLNLQGIGVNVGTSLHHSQHTTQHTLNVAGLHHLHHGGLHQGTFSPQLSLVTAGTPTLTINSFTTPNSQGTIVQPSTGVLLHEYQSSHGQNNITACTPSTVNVSTLPSAAACSVSTMMVQDGQNANTFLQSTMKKRESFVTTQAQIKVENTTTTRQSCVCKSSNVTGKTKMIHSEAGCSRTLPVVSSWNNQDLSTHTSATSIIKREPMTSTVPCQVAEVSTSLHATTTEVKIEPLSQKTENGIVVSTAPGTGIPVGIAVARQRLQHQETSSTSMRNVSLSHHTSHHASFHHFQPDNLGSTTAMTMGGATLVHCGSSGDNRAPHIAIPTGNTLAPAINAALSSTLNSATIPNIGATQQNSNASTATWQPTLWQYPTAAMPALEPVGFPQLSVGLQGGLQLVRDPSTGHLLLIHGADGLTTTEQMQQAVVWPTFQNHNGSSIGTQPLLLPPPSLQLFNDMNGTRLILTDNKRKSQNNNVPIVKIEADCSSPHTSVIESSKALQTVTTMSSPVIPESPLLTTLHYYPHAPTLVQISQSESTHCRTQHRNAFIPKATSPVSCLTPPPEIATTQSLGAPENLPLIVQDASNQTDAPETDEEHVQLPENFVKHEQLLSNQQLPGSINVVSSTGKPQVSLQPYNLITKIDKSENTIKISNLKSENFVSNSLKNDAVSSVDRTIESVISCRSTKPENDDEESVNVDDNSGDRVSRTKSRIIEITEENCDSFHEDLEFFGRRRDPVEQYRRPVFSEELFTEEKILEEKRRKKSLNNFSDADDFQNFHNNQKEEIPIDKENYSQAISSSLEHNSGILQDVGTALSEEKLEKHQEIDLCSSISSNDANKYTQISVKSFDMPSIDCEDDEQTNIKEEKKLTKLKNCEIEENEMNTHENSQKNNDKRNMPDKSHPGIENVIEKLKKNVAAAFQHQESSTIIHGKEKILKHSEIPRAVVHCQSRLENGLKKHILKSCELELHLELTKNHKKLLSINPVTSSKNNNDCNSSNQNFILLENEINSKENEKSSSSPIKIIESTFKKKCGVDFINSSPSNSTITSKELEKSKNLINSSTTKSRVDLSGLELLSNSIAELEHIKSVEDSSNRSEREISPTKETLEVIQNENNNNEVDSPLGLLCALAEQRFMEEVGDKVQPNNSEELSHAGKLLLSLEKITTDKLQKRKHSSDDVELKSHKKSRKNTHFSGKNISNRTRGFEDSDADDDFTDSESEISKRNNRNKLRNLLQNNEDVDVENPTNNEKQRKSLKLSPEKDEKIYSDYETELEDSPIGLQSAKYNALFNELSIKNSKIYNSNMLEKSKCNLNLTKIINESQSHIKLLDGIPSISIPAPSVPFTKSTRPDDEKISGFQNEEISLMPSPTAASKNRKVGRPKKCTLESSGNFTQTLITTTSQCGNLHTNYIVNTKNRQDKFNGKPCYTPLSFKSNVKNPNRLKSHRIKKLNIKSSKQTPLHNKNVISSIIAEKAKLSQETKCEKQIVKLKPKLKAEVKLKTWNTDQDTECNYTIESRNNSLIFSNKSNEIPVLAKDRIKDNKQDCNSQKLKKKKRKSTSSSPSLRKIFKNDERPRTESKRRKSSDCRNCKECLKAAKFEKEKTDSVNNKCKITAQHLEIDQMRVLTAMGGLFYAGRLSAIQAPDIYSITLDGERGNRPHIHSREEILKDAIVEVCPASTKELPPGTRLCAYWSQQYRCLYPGTSVEASESDSELDDKFVSVEFDDGDSGRIALNDIRLLQPNYPVVEYDPNPLLTLGKRRRQVSSSTDDKRPSDISLQSSNFQSTDTLSYTQISSSKKLFNVNATKSLEEYRERKRLKKRRRDKLKRLHEAQEGKKKHKKHKCCEEHRKHRHRKHRKHKHRHNHHGSYSTGSYVSGGESCTGPKSDEGHIATEISVTSPGKNKIQDSNTGTLKIDEIQSNVDTTEIEIVEKMDKSKKVDKKDKAKECPDSVESRSKMAAFLPAKQLWGWSGKGYRRPGAKGRAKKQFFKAIQRGGEAIQIGDSAVFLSTGRPDRPYIGRIESMWETSSSNMIVKVKWFYHPEETVGCPNNLKYPGALFESPHMDENDVQTISHKCEVLPLADYTEKLGKEPHRYLTIYDNNDIYYLAGYYDPTTYLLTMKSGVV